MNVDKWINSFDKLKVYNMLKSMVFYCTCIVVLGLLMENNIYFSSIRQVAQSRRFSSTFVSSVPLSLALHTLLIAVFSHILPNKETAGCRVGTRGLIAWGQLNRTTSISVLLHLYVCWLCYCFKVVCWSLWKKWSQNPVSYAQHRHLLCCQD